MRLVRRDGRMDFVVSEDATGRGLSVKLLDSPVEGAFTEGPGCRKMVFQPARSRLGWNSLATFYTSLSKPVRQSWPQL